MWIGNLANNDIRRCLEIAKNVITSPHLEVQERISAYVDGTNIHVPPHKIKRALFRGQYDIYPGELNPAVRNIYAIEDELVASPLLGLRLLQLLKDAMESDMEDSFVTLEQIVEYFRAMLVEPAVITAWLSRMLESGLVLSYDPRVTEIRNTGKIELAPSGLQHWLWGIHDSDYVQAMLEVTPIADQGVFAQLSSLASQPNSVTWRNKLDCFVSYLISEDAKHCRVPEHEAYVTQKRLVAGLTQMVAHQHR